MYDTIKQFELDLPSVVVDGVFYNFCLYCGDRLGELDFTDGLSQTCIVCKLFGGRKESDMDIRIEAKEPEVSVEDFRRIFNEKTTGIVELHKEGGIEAVIAAMRKIDEAIVEMKVNRAAHYAFINDAIERANDEERRKIRELDKLYKPKQPSARSAERTRSAAPRAAGKSKQEKAVETLLAMGFSRAEIEKKLAKKA